MAGSEHIDTINDRAVEGAMIVINRLSAELSQGSLTQAKLAQIGKEIVLRLNDRFGPHPS